VGGFPEYERHDGLGLAELVRGGEVTPAELVEEAIARVERLNPLLNAVIHPMYDTARRTAAGPVAGPFAGVPFLIKDLVALVAGEPYRAGSRLLEKFVPDHDSTLVARYRRAGLLLLGKTNTPEFGLTPFTEPERFGPTRNPWNPARTPGGSSGGSAAAVAAGMVPLAGGGDGGGSIRIPASCCGLFGLKPTRGRTPTGPDRGELWQGCVVEHALTRSVRDSAALLDATAGAETGAPYQIPPPARPYLEEVSTPPGPLRVAYTARPWLGHTVHPDCLAALERTVDLLRSLGHEVREDDPRIDGPEFARAFVVMICGEVAGDLTEAAGLVSRRRPSPTDVEVETWGLGVLGRSLAAERFVSATRYLARAARDFQELFERYDVLLTPTLSCPPPPIGSLRLAGGRRALLAMLGRLRAGRVLQWGGAIGDAANTIFEFIPWTPVANVTGQPAMSVPLEWNADGLPIGMHFVGRWGDEGTLFRLAGQLERARPWFDRRPPVA
jgi:amidase